MIKKLFGIVGLLISVTVSCAQNIDVLHYKFLLELNDKNDTVKGLAVITFVHGANDGLVCFDLHSVGKEGKGMKVHSDSGDSDLNPLTFTQTEDKVSVNLPHIKKGDTITLMIAYKGIPSDGLIISKNKYGYRTFFADNWPNRAHHWIPCVDRPDDKASFEFIVTAPSYYDVVSNGSKVEEIDLGNGKKITRWKEDTPQPTKVMVIGVAKFAVKTFKDSPKNIPISAWVYPQDSSKGFYDYALAPEIVKFFSSYIAPYPYKKLANVQSTTIFGGMENASAIFYAENSVKGDRSSEDLLAHEIAHQWFGDMASEKSFAHLWLSEGFATYFTNLYLENKYGRETLIKRLKKDRQEVIVFAKKSTHAVVDSTKDLMSLLNVNSYQKGGWVLHMLRTEVGDTIFQKIIQTYYNQYKGGNADTKDFEAVAEKVSGKNLGWFFNQWLYQPRLPQLKIQWQHQKGKLNFTILQAQKESYQFPLEVQVVNKDGSSAFVKLNIQKKKEIISVPAIKQPSKIVIDPNTDLLFEEMIK